MKMTHGLIAGGLAAMLLSFSAHAQPVPGGGMGGMSGMGPGPQAAPVDCSKASNPQHCADRQKAQAACQDLRGTARQDCMTDNMPPPDCGKSANPERCAAQQTQRLACKGKYGPDRQACVKENPVPSPAQGTRGAGMGPAMGGATGMGGMGPCGSAGAPPCPRAAPPAAPPAKP
jgi:hypothetical protein